MRSMISSTGTGTRRPTSSAIRSSQRWTLVGSSAIGGNRPWCRVGRRPAQQRVIPEVAMRRKHRAKPDSNSWFLHSPFLQPRAPHAVQRHSG